MKDLGHGIGHNVGSVAALIPWLPGHLRLKPSKHDRLRDQPLVPELVILGFAPRPGLADVLRKFCKVLLGSSRNDMGLTCRRELELCEVRLAEELRLREFQIELLLLGEREAGTSVDELPA